MPLPGASAGGFVHARSSSRSICSGLTNCDQPLFHRLASAMGMSGLSRQDQMPQPDANYAPQTSNGTTTEYFSKSNVFATFRSFGRLSSDYDEFNKTRTVPLNYALDHPWEKNFFIKDSASLDGKCPASDYTHDGPPRSSRTKPISRYRLEYSALERGVYLNRASA